MRKNLSKTYREINIMLDLLGDEFKARLPKSMIPFFKEHEDKSYNPKITLSDDGFSENIQTDTFVLMSMMYINYWCDDPEEKAELRHQWMSTNFSSDYDVFSADAYKKNLGINAATAKYKESSDEVQGVGIGETVEVDMNKYGNLFDSASSSNTSNNLITNNTQGKSSKVKNVFVKITDSLKGLFAAFGKK